MPRRTKRRDAWASITEVRAGECYRIRYWATGLDGYKRRSRTVRGTRRDAERVRAELMLAHSEDAPCPTVGEVWDRWALPAYERRVADGEMSAQTLAVYRSAWVCHVSPRWGDVPCDVVRPLHVQQWLDGMGRSEAVAAIRLLRPMLDYAVRYGVIDTNPFRERYVMPSRSTVSARDAGVWTLPELGEVWRAVMGSPVEPAFLLAGFGGLRVGEALGVRGSDVTTLDVGGQRVALVRVERQVLNLGGRVTDALKNAQSRRTVAVPGRAGARLVRLAESGGYLSGDGVGGVMDQKRLRRMWDAAPLPDGLRHPFRNLRNSWQTNMRWSLRLPPWLIEPMMGHVGEGVTGRHYDRPQAEMFAEAVADAYAAEPFDAGWVWATWDD